MQLLCNFSVTRMEVSEKVILVVVSKLIQFSEITDLHNDLLRVE